MRFEVDWDALPYTDRVRYYLDSVVENFNHEAVFTDVTEQFVQPFDPDPGDTVTVRIRVGAGQVDRVYVIVRHEDKRRRLRMRSVRTENEFEYFEGTFVMPEGRVIFRYEIVAGKVSFYYNKMGLQTFPHKSADFELQAGFHVPEWARGAVMYQIFPDRFCNGDSTNDVEDDEYCYLKRHVRKIRRWNELPAEFDVHNFYGGDLAGVHKKLGYLKSLGIDAIYFNPLFVSPSNHKYDGQDYDAIDPHLGVIVRDAQAKLSPADSHNYHSEKYMRRVTDPQNLAASNEYFAEFVKKAHGLGIRVILDGVFNHCGSFHKWMDREHIYENAPGYPAGAYLSEESEYHDYFLFRDREHKAWPDNDSYEGWWDHETLPKLNYEGSEQLKREILEIAAKWVQPPYNADGWRLDVAADLGHSPEFNHSFWREFRDTVKEANPDALIIAEHYGDPHDWLQGDQWDSVMNYDGFMEPVSWFLTGMEKHSDEFRGDLLGDGAHFRQTMEQQMSRVMTQSQQTAMNQLSNHDHSRFMTRTNSRVGRLQTAGAAAASEGIRPVIFGMGVLMQMTWPGMPTVYYGDEAGVCGWTDPDNRRTYPWGEEDQKLIELHRELIRIHKGYGALRHGSTKFLNAGQDFLCYTRFDEKNRFVVVINRGDAREISLPVWQMGGGRDERYTNLIIINEEGYDVSAAEFDCEDGMLRLQIPACCGILLKNLVIY
ncbi:MAG: glycoside hydrolase family 13 protein [Lachnospiraceae bacterium]|nr:glycoside hydrolase family 13 protein [Lachnospiraceae bacterium]